MSEVLTQPAAVTEATTEVLTPAAISVPPAPTTASGTQPADGATTPTQPIATPSSAGAKTGLTVGEIKTQDHLDEFVRAIEAGTVKDLALEPAPAPAAQAVEPPVTQEAGADAIDEPAPAAERLDEPLFPGDKPNHRKVPTKDDPLAFEALRIFTERKLSGKPITLTEAEALGRQVLGLEASAPTSAPEALTQPPETEQPPSEKLPASSTETIAEMKRLTAERNKLANGFRWDEANEIDQKLIDLAEHRDNLRNEESRRRDESSSYTSDWNKAATAEASRLQAQGAGNPKSALEIVAAAVQFEMVESSDPRLRNPLEAPRLIYQEALTRLGHKSAAPSNAQPDAISPAPTVQPAPHRALSPAQALLASTSSAGAPPGQAKMDLSTIKNGHDLDQLIAAMKL